MAVVQRKILGHVLDPYEPESQTTNPQLAGQSGNCAPTLPSFALGTLPHSVCTSNALGVILR